MLFQIVGIFFWVNSVEEYLIILIILPKCNRHTHTLAFTFTCDKAIVTRRHAQKFKFKGTYLLQPSMWE